MKKLGILLTTNDDKYAVAGPVRFQGELECGLSLGAEDVRPRFE